jgi:hypothetical protein
MSRLMLSVALILSLSGCTANPMHTERVPKEEARLWSGSSK